MKISNLLLISTTCIALSACSSPEDNARAVIADYCEAFKNKDVDTLQTLSTDPKLIKFPFISDSERQKASCGQKVKKVSEEKYIFILGDEPMPMPIVVENVDGDFKITGLNM
ncbi:MAG: hypothetical protein OQK09_12180 [Colwellia sp.]|nr:hypothetical protein [Colwellia sp.]MCW8864503.1 hypothetical protein [Colwellia sp.]MCW9082261.1 hypothetical protein [Colwellia sp.]